MRRLLARTGLATRLVIVLVVLIVLTTLSAGVPAYLLARSQLEQQAWEQVDATQRATESLYEATLRRVIDLTALLAQRPTLRALVTDRDTVALESYLNGFMEQSDLDLSELCDEDGAWITTGISLDLCAIAPDGGIVLVEGQPLMLARQAIRLEDSPETLGTVLSGLRLDAEFLAGLSANTGVEQTILAGEQPVSSTLPAGPVSVELSLSGQQIAAGEGVGNGVGLDRRRLLEAELADGVEQTRVESERGERHANSICASGRTLSVERLRELPAMLGEKRRNCRRGPPFGAPGRERGQQREGLCHKR